ncbi:hypothetical protein B0H13DRAFT_1873886 [Mycena leptocephala]|nr:hypothetical protein B0H13DRAFT_1873886 [Mycena leptocephala]
MAQVLIKKPHAKAFSGTAGPKSQCAAAQAAKVPGARAWRADSRGMMAPLWFLRQFSGLDYSHGPAGISGNSALRTYVTLGRGVCLLDGTPATIRCMGETWRVNCHIDVLTLTSRLPLPPHPSTTRMFNNSAGFQFHGGTFYSVSGDVHLQTHQHLTIQGRNPQEAALQLPAGSPMALDDGSAEGSGHELSGITRNPRLSA